MTAEWMAWRPEHFHGKTRADPKKRVPPAMEARDLAIAHALDPDDADRIHAEAVEAAARIMAAFNERTGR